jgi:toxic protein SymE
MPGLGRDDGGVPLLRQRERQQARRFQRNWIKPQHLRTEPPLYPWMKLAGRWIEQVGFEAGQRVRVAVEHGRLIITAE